MLSEAWEFAREIEGGRVPACFAGRGEAARYLERLIVAAEYETAEERHDAQRLLIRLARVDGRPEAGR